MDPETRRRRYGVLMALCLGLFLLAGLVVRHWSPPAAIALCIVASVIPPIASVVANWGALRDRRPPHFPIDPDR